MDKGQNLFDSWVNSQMELFDTCLESQERFMANWIDSVRSLHKSLKTAPESNEIPGMDIFNPFFKTWFDSSSALSEEIFEKQQHLKNSIEQQVEIFAEMVEKTSKSFK